MADNDLDDCRSGLLVTLDGQSGVGKTTTARLLSEVLQRSGRRVLSTRTPSSSELGKLARSGTFQLLGRELTLLVAADRFHHYRTVIRPAIADGATVICDRYLASSLVLDPCDGVEPDLVWAVYRGLPLADLTIILYGDPARCARRAAARGNYSRFHTPDPVANGRERTAFVRAADSLRWTGHPVITHDVGTDPADTVAGYLAGLIADLERNSR